MMSRCSFGPRLRGFLAGLSARFTGFLVIWYTLSHGGKNAPAGTRARTPVAAGTRLQTARVYLFHHGGIKNPHHGPDALPSKLKRLALRLFATAPVGSCVLRGSEYSSGHRLHPSGFIAH